MPRFPALVNAAANDVFDELLNRDDDDLATNFQSISDRVPSDPDGTRDH